MFKIKTYNDNFFYSQLKCKLWLVTTITKRKEKS